VQKTNDLIAFLKQFDADGKKLLPRLTNWLAVAGAAAPS
jgi:hypothetical protein